MGEYQHAEAFRLMTYEADDGSEREVIWNSRDGVTPFVITLRSGKPARHINWLADPCVPNYKPALGDRIFVDLTPKRAQQHALRRAEQFWADNVLGCREQFTSVEAMAEVLAGDTQPGAPDLIEVAG